MTSDDLPLSGKTVVVTRARDQAHEQASLLENAGARPLVLPLIEILPPSSWESLDEALSVLPHGAYQWVLFTSANAVRFVAGRIDEKGLTRVFARTQVGAVGKATAGLLRERGIEVDLVPEAEHGEALAAALGKGVGTILLPRVEGAPRALVDSLTRRGWRIDEVAAYRNVRPRLSPLELEPVTSGRFDAVTFASPSAVRNFVDLVGNPGALGLTSHPSDRRVVACLGPVTARAAAAAHLRVDMVAPEQSDAGLVAALADYFRRQSTRPEKLGDGNIAP